MSATLTPPATGTTGTTPTKRRRTNIVVAVISVLVMTLVVGYFVMPDRYAFAIDSVTVTRIPAKQEVIYGKVTAANGAGQRGFSVTVFQQHRVRRHRKIVKKYVRVARSTTNAQGLHRKALREPRGVYKVVISGRIGGKLRSAAKVLTLKPGHAYRFNARITKRRMFTLLPVSSY